MKKHTYTSTSCRRITTTFIGFLFLYLCTGCSYAPPVRIDHAGAPATPKAGHAGVMISGTLAGPVESGGGTVAANIGVNDKMQVELGGNALHDQSAMGFAGLRYAPLNGRYKSKLRPTLDFEGGIGLGVGGSHDCYESDESEDNCVEGVDYDEMNWHDRFAGGGYLGVGVGFNVSWFDFFFRSRVQLVGAENVPLTFWWSTALGVQATIADRLKIHLAGGTPYGFITSEDSLVSAGSIELGIAVNF